MYVFKVLCVDAGDCSRMYELCDDHNADLAEAGLLHVQVVEHTIFAAGIGCRVHDVEGISNITSGSDIFPKENPAFYSDLQWSCYISCGMRLLSMSPSAGLNVDLLGIG